MLSPRLSTGLMLFVVSVVIVCSPISVVQALPARYAVVEQEVLPIIVSTPDSFFHSWYTRINQLWQPERDAAVRAAVVHEPGLYSEGLVKKGSWEECYGLCKVGEGHAECSTCAVLKRLKNRPNWNDKKVLEQVCALVEKAVIEYYRQLFLALFERCDVFLRAPADLIKAESSSSYRLVNGLTVEHAVFDNLYEAIKGGRQHNFLLSQYVEVILGVYDSKQNAHSSKIRLPNGEERLLFVHTEQDLLINHLQKYNVDLTDPVLPGLVRLMVGVEKATTVIQETFLMRLRHVKQLWLSGRA